jgi:hypothetical protein
MSLVLSRAVEDSRDNSVPRRRFFARAIALLPDLLFRRRNYVMLIVIDLFCVGLSSFAVVVVRQARLRL